MRNLNKMILVMMSVTLLATTSCLRERICGEGSIKTQERNVSSFEKINMYGSAEVNIVYGPVVKVTVTDYANLLPYIETEVNGSTLEIQIRDKVFIRNSQLKVYIETPTYSGGRIEGSSKTTATGPFENNTIDFDIDGSGDVVIKNVSVQNVKLEINGSGTINTTGLYAENGDATINGSGTIKINAYKYLDAKINGSGNIYYMADPKINVTIAGSGNVKKL